MLFGHVLNALGPNLATVRSHTIPTDAAGSGTTGEGKAGNKRTRSPAPEVAGGNKRRSRDGTEENGKVSETGKAPMDVVREEGVGQSKGGSGAMVVKSELEPEPEPADPLEEGLGAAKQAFSRVLAVWEGAATEGKRELHQRVISRLGRMLAEAEVAVMVAQGGNGSKSKVRLVTVRGGHLTRRAESRAPKVFLALRAVARSRGQSPLDKWCTNALFGDGPHLARAGVPLL